MNEEVFWRHYFSRIYFLRYKYGVDSPTPSAYLDSLSQEDVIFSISSAKKNDQVESQLSDLSAGTLDTPKLAGAISVVKDEDENTVTVGVDSCSHAAESAALAAEV